jgi:hypothetical protein
MWNLGYVNREADSDNESTGYYADDLSNASNVNFYQEIWSCENKFTDAGAGDNKGYYVSECTMKMGDGTLDWDLGERCEPGLRPVKTLRASDENGADISGDSNIGSTAAGYDCGTESGLECSDMGGDTGSSGDGSYGITASLFRWNGATIMDKYNYDNDNSEVRNYMLMGCHHTIVTHSDTVMWPRLAQPVNGWEFPTTTGISYPDTLGTDTCGDNIYDGEYPEVGRKWPQNMGLDTESSDTEGPMF